MYRNNSRIDGPFEAYAMAPQLLPTKRKYSKGTSVAIMPPA